MAGRHRGLPELAGGPAHPTAARLTKPVLMISGDRDLSTPVEWARRQASVTPYGRLVVIEGMGHSIQGRNADGDQAVREFLSSPCGIRGATCR